MSIPGLVFLIVFFGLVAFGIVYTHLRNREINANGIETDAVVSRVEIRTSTDADGHRSTSKDTYVSYRTAEGQTVEAVLGMEVLGSPPDRYPVGTPLRIKYLPEKPKYVLLVK